MSSNCPLLKIHDIFLNTEPSNFNSCQCFKVLITSFEIIITSFEVIIISFEVIITNFEVIIISFEVLILVYYF